MVDSLSFFSKLKMKIFDSLHFRIGVSHKRRGMLADGGEEGRSEFPGWLFFFQGSRR